MNHLKKEWNFVIDGTEHFRKTMEEACADLPVETRDGEQYVTVKYKDFQKLMEFYMKKHSSDLPF